MTATDPADPSTTPPSPSSEEQVGEARPLLDVFEGLVVPHANTDDIEVSNTLEIDVQESNLRVRFVGDTHAPSLGSENEVLPGKLEVELLTAGGRTIDTLSMSQLTMSSLKKILTAFTQRDMRERFLGLGRLSGDTFLSQGKLRNLLTQAGAEGVQINSSLGVAPSDIASNYNRQYSRAKSDEDNRERYLDLIERSATLSIVHHGLAQAKALGINKVLVPVHTQSIVAEVSRSREDIDIIWVVPKAAVEGVNLSEDEGGDVVYFSTNPKISPDAEQRLALFSALARGHLTIDERVLCLKGASHSPNLSGYEIVAPPRIFSWISKESLESLQSIPKSSLEVIERVVDIAMKFSREGIEGKYFGATFVVGRGKKLAPFLKQVMHNPLEGLDIEDRSLYDPRFLRTLRAAASVENAVIIRPDGLVSSAWTNIVAPTDEIETRDGWGSRHVSAVAITAVTEAFSVTISESTGDVTLMWAGKPILELSPR